MVPEVIELKEYDPRIQDASQRLDDAITNYVAAGAEYSALVNQLEITVETLKLMEESFFASVKLSQKRKKELSKEFDNEGNQKLLDDSEIHNSTIQDDVQTVKSMVTVFKSFVDNYDVPRVVELAGKMITDFAEKGEILVPSEKQFDRAIVVRQADLELDVQILAGRIGLVKANEKRMQDQYLEAEKVVDNTYIELEQLFTPIFDDVTTTLAGRVAKLNPGIVDLMTTRQDELALLNIPALNNLLLQYKEGEFRFVLPRGNQDIVDTVITVIYVNNPAAIPILLESYRRKSWSDQGDDLLLRLKNWLKKSDAVLKTADLFLSEKTVQALNTVFAARAPESKFFEVIRAKITKGWEPDPNPAALSAKLKLAWDKKSEEYRLEKATEISETGKLALRNTFMGQPDFQWTKKVNTQNYLGLSDSFHG